LRRNALVHETLLLGDLFTLGFPVGCVGARGSRNARDVAVDWAAGGRVFASAEAARGADSAGLLVLDTARLHTTVGLQVAHSAATAVIGRTVAGGWCTRDSERALRGRVVDGGRDLARTNVRWDVAVLVRHVGCVAALAGWARHGFRTWRTGEVTKAEGRFADGRAGGLWEAAAWIDALAVANRSCWVTHRRHAEQLVAGAHRLAQILRDADVGGVAVVFALVCLVCEVLLAGRHAAANCVAVSIGVGQLEEASLAVIEAGLCAAFLVRVAAGFRGGWWRLWFAVEVFGLGIEQVWIVRRFASLHTAFERFAASGVAFLFRGGVGDGFAIVLAGFDELAAAAGRTFAHCGFVVVRGVRVAVRWTRRALGARGGIAWWNRHITRDHRQTEQQIKTIHAYTSRQQVSKYIWRTSP
jgi:hypothetical protein